MKFKIEQVALCPPDPAAAIELLIAMGMTEWAHDIVEARGVVRNGSLTRKTKADVSTNIAALAFNYQALTEAKELEVLHYQYGANWMSGVAPSVSHLGMHVLAPEAEEWRKFFRKRGIKVAQEVKTRSHTNPVIAGKRWYHYIIFDTRAILGVDIKLIVRREKQ